MKRHAFDPTSFVFGLLFSVIALAALAGGVDVDGLRLQWLFPLALIVTGVVVIGSSVTGSRVPAVAPDGPEAGMPDTERTGESMVGSPVDPEVLAGTDDGDVDLDDDVDAL